MHDAVTVGYRLIDFGDGRKLEALGDYVVDRPSPAAEGHRCRRPRAWDDAAAYFDEVNREWRFRSAWPEALWIDCGSFAMPSRPTPYGHIGLFPEQQTNWQWLAKRPALQEDQAINLFAYTGASSIALAKANYLVTHVDAAKPNVVAAAEAARMNGWEKPPIRFWVDDAASIMVRENRRERRYHTVVLDPPAYGHSPKGKAWRLERDLWPMLDAILENIDPAYFRLLLTGHSPQVDQHQVVAYLSTHARLRTHWSAFEYEASRSHLIDESGRGLDTGFVVRVQCGN